MLVERGRIPAVATRTFALLLASACGLGLGGTGGGGDDGDSGGEASPPPGSQACEPSTTQSCTCPNGETGTATCMADGHGFGACSGCPTSHTDAGSPHDAKAPATADADASPPATGGADAGVCATCVAASCPGAQAACGAGTDCQALLECDLACANDDASNCSDECTDMHPAGAMAFATLTVCSLACGAGCLAEATSGPDDGGSD